MSLVIICKMDSDNTDSSPSDLPEWIGRLYKDEEIEGNSPQSVRLLNTNGRTFIWWMCKTLGIRTSGVAGQACQLYEWYLASHIRKLGHLSPMSHEWKQAKQALIERTPLLIAVCIQLSAKMSAVNEKTNAAALRAILRYRNLFCELDEINAAEVDVFKTLGYRIPLWTNVEKAEMVAREVGLPECHVEGAGLMMDIAEYHKATLQRDVKKIAFASTSSSQESADSMSCQVVSEPGASCTSTDTDRPPMGHAPREGVILSTHLVAGVVAANARFMGYSGPEPVPRLSVLTRTPVNYINCIADVILSTISETQDNVSLKRANGDMLATTSKRKRFPKNHFKDKPNKQNLI